MTTTSAANRVETDHAKRGVAAVVGAIVVWSFVGIIIKASSVSALTFTFWRLWIGGLGLWVVGMLRRKPLTGRGFRLAALGGVLLGANMLSQFAAFKLTSIADVQLILALQPGLVLVVAAPLLGEAIGARRVGWTLLSVIGVSAVIVGTTHDLRRSISGDVLALVALVTWTAFVLVTKRVRAKIDAFEYMTGVVLVAAVMVTPLMAVLPHGAGPRAVDWILILIIAFGPGTGGHLLMSWALRYVDVTLASLIVVTQPVIAAMAAFAILGERLSVLQVIGGSIALIGVVFVIAESSKKSRAELPGAFAPVVEAP